MIRIAVTIALLSLHSIFYGQASNGGRTNILAVDFLTKRTITAGDTILMKVRNLSSASRGFTIEAVSMNKEPGYESAVYSAFFNNDNSFFQKLEASKKLSKKEKLPYVLPDYKLRTYELEGYSERLLTFIVKGIPLRKGIPVKLRITTDIINDESETVFSDVLTISSMPD
ncbi:hypothetical protein A4H97_25500 [Niastella yeongjuensis]|uniref:Uncharacterized protein n=1 Tax=Niastella yeongjuensis TaxID=354355 RepID=A0A1V9F0V2_9BACT|nr:hypothetical protein [Niastella yeongjuensis]OQP51977.1 hypothetical protein A4H97_25500 [Niastella yeongjuensis]SEP35975.1 hypothetical protein SAMN05660816_05443 [Niastella yeongjuensis]